MRKQLLALKHARVIFVASLQHGVKIMSECLQPDSDPSSCKLQSYLNISQAQRLGSVELKQLQTLLEKVGHCRAICISQFFCMLQFTHI